MNDKSSTYRVEIKNGSTPRSESYNWQIYRNRDVLPILRSQQVFASRMAALVRISHTDECIGAPNRRKLLCSNDFLPIRGASRCRQSVAQISLDLHL
jgi:hypothetical protein